MSGPVLYVRGCSLSGAVLWTEKGERLFRTVHYGSWDALLRWCDWAGCRLVRLPGGWPEAVTGKPLMLRRRA